MNSGKRAEISVEDNGIGLDEKMFEILFDISVNTKRKGTEDEPSTDPGLQISRVSVDNNGGTIEVDSEFETGTRILVSLHPENHT